MDADQNVTPPPSPDRRDDAEQKPRQSGGTWSWLLVLSGIGLWGALLGTILIFAGAHGSHGGWGQAMFFGLVLLACLAAGCVGCVLLLLYIVIKRPWRLPNRGGLGFWLQVVIALFVLVCAGKAIHEQYQSDAVDAKVAADKDRLNQDQQRMMTALRVDNQTDFSAAYLDCDDSCRKEEWVTRAVIAGAPNSLAFLLHGVTPQSYSKLDDETIPSYPGYCSNGSFHYSVRSIARMVGIRNIPAITQQFLPLWSATDRDHAFLGAVMGGNTGLMDELVTQGVNPQKIKAELGEEDSPFANAAAGGAAASLSWLAKAGITVHTQDDAEAVWRNLADWTAYSAPDTAAKALDVWFAQSANIHFDHGAKLDSAVELSTVMDRNSQVLAQAMLDHGYSAKDLSADDQQRLQQLLTQGPSDLDGPQQQQRWCKGSDWLVDDLSTF